MPSLDGWLAGWLEGQPSDDLDYRGAEELLDTLVQALIRRVVGDGRDSRQTLHPWSLVMYRDGFYVLARPACGRGARSRGVRELVAAELASAVRPHRPG